MVGPLMNTLPCRLAVDADSPLGPWLQQVRSQWIELHAHEQTPLDTVGAWSSLPPGMPPFDSVVVYAANRWRRPSVNSAAHGKIAGSAVRSAPTRR